MSERLASWWYAAREGLWFLPALLTLAAALLAIGLVELDRELALDRRGGRVWAFGGGAVGARGVLQAIAGSIITVTGTVFSITIVALQLASSQFTPRVLRTFTRDRGVQLVLGVFVGTFTYALLVLRVVRSQTDDVERFVPGVAVVGAIILALVSVGHLIYFVHHVASSIRVSAVLERVTRDGIELLDRRLAKGTGGHVSRADASRAVSSTLAAVVLADEDGYLQVVSIDALVGFESSAELTIRIERVAGDFVLSGEPLASIWPAAAATEELVKVVRRGCVLGPDRTLEEDVELPVRQLADIAVKALSPGVNDPTTATTCLDRLAQLLAHAAHNDPVRAFRRDGSPVCLIVSAVSFDRLVETAIAQVAHYGAGDATVITHLLRLLGRLAALVPMAHRPVLVDHGRLALAAARHGIPLAGELDRVEAAAGWLSAPGKGTRDDALR